MQLKRHFLYFLILLPALPLYCMDTSHFYRAHPFWDEPRFEKNLLSSVTIYQFGGSTCTSFNCLGHKTSLLNLYGPHKLQFLGNGVPDLSSQNSFDKILIDLSSLPIQPHFADLIFSGKFSTWEAQFNIYQNFCHGFFTHINIPIRTLELSNIQYKDCSLTEGFPNRYHPTWQAFLASFDNILFQHGLKIRQYCKTQVGDMSVLGGWTINYEDTSYIDFIDFTAQIGLLFPTAKKQSKSNIFDIAPGYNGHFGLTGLLDTSFGLYDWLTLGYHSGFLILFKKCGKTTIRTDHTHNGFIKLAATDVKKSPGAYWQSGVFCKTDHICGGFSLYLGYIFDIHGTTKLRPNYGSYGINFNIANNDPMLHGWKMHTLNLMLEYDFARQNRPNAPRIAFMYNHIIKGQQIFDNSTVGGSFGVDIDWRY